MSDGVRFYSAGPLSVFAIILLIALVVLLIPLLILGIIGAAFTRLGFSWISALAVVMLMLFGSFVNIPVYHVRRDMIRFSHDEATAFDVCVPCATSQVWDTTISLNLGGAVIPVCISLYSVPGDTDNRTLPGFYGMCWNLYCCNNYFFFNACCDIFRYTCISSHSWVYRTSYQLASCR